MTIRIDSLTTSGCMRLIRSAVMALLLGLCTAGASQAQIYYVDDDEVWTAELDGTNPSVLVDRTGNPRGIVVDEENGHLFWTDDYESDGQIFRASLDGSDMEVLYEGGSTRGIALDPEGDKIYWANLRSNGELLRANLDGSESEILVAGETGGETDGILDVALDLDAGKVYWTRFGGIMRADLDGSNAELFIELASHIQPPSVDVENGYVYWVNPSADDIERSSTAEVSIETVVNADEPEGVVVEGGRLYWMNSFLFSGGGGNIMRSELDGSNPELVLDDLSFPEGPFTVVGEGTDTAIDDPRELPSAVAAVDVYPAPYRGAATAAVELAWAQPVEVDVVDALGRQVATVYDGHLSAGRHDLSVSADLPSGLYFLRVRTGSGVQATPLVSVR